MWFTCENNRNKSRLPDEARLGYKGMAILGDAGPWFVAHASQFFVVFSLNPSWDRKSADAPVASVAAHPDGFFYLTFRKFPNFGHDVG